MWRGGQKPAPTGSSARQGSAWEEGAGKKALLPNEGASSRPRGQPRGPGEQAARGPQREPPPRRGPVSPLEAEEGLPLKGLNGGDRTRADARFSKSRLFAASVSIRHQWVRPATPHTRHQRQAARAQVLTRVRAAGQRPRRNPLLTAQLTPASRRLRNFYKGGEAPPPARSRESSGLAGESAARPFSCGKLPSPFPRARTPRPPGERPRRPLVRTSARSDVSSWRGGGGAGPASGFPRGARSALSRLGIMAAAATMANSGSARKRLLKEEDMTKVEFETSEEVDVTPTFDTMGLREDLLRGIYAYGWWARPGERGAGVRGREPRGGLAGPGLGAERPRPGPDPRRSEPRPLAGDPLSTAPSSLRVRGLRVLSSVRSNVRVPRRLHSLPGVRSHSCSGPVSRIPRCEARALLL